MGTWNGLVYNNGLGLNDNLDWLEIEIVNLGDPEILDVDGGETPTPTKSFIQLEHGTVPSTSQCSTIGTGGLSTGVILVIKGLSSEVVSMLGSVGNLNLESPFALTSNSTLVLVRGPSWHEISRSDNN
jgi:hypothetical protein